MARIPVPNSEVDVSTYQAWKKQLFEKKQPVKRLLHADRVPHNVLVIGSGHRITTNFIPALQSLEAIFNVIGIWSRTREHAQYIENTAGWPAISDIDRVHLNAADLIVISITASAVPNVLKMILNTTDCSNKHLVIDTPVFAGFRQSLFTPLLRHFANVTVTEDYMNFPQFTLLRHHTNTASIGSIKKVTLNNTGYLYHGLALGRSFFDFDLVKHSNRNQLGVNYVLNNGGLIELVLPYRRLEGSVSVVGEKGDFHYVNSVNEKSQKAALSRYENVITEAWEKNTCIGFMVKTKGSSRLSSFSLNDITIACEQRDRLFQQCKTFGLIDVFKSLSDHNINGGYNYLQALYDNYVSHISCQRTGKLVWDYRLIMKWLELTTLR